MVGTIGSVGYGASGSAKRTWRRLISYYALGSILGGGMLGAVVGSLALAIDRLETLTDLSTAATNSLGVSILLVMAARDLAGIRVPIPSRDRQVPLAWKRLPGYWSPFVYGFSLGTGVSTAIYLGSFYAMLVVAVLLRDLTTALLIGVTYALARGFLVPIATRTSGGPEGLVERLAPHQRIVALVNGGLTLACAGVFIAA